MIAEFNNPATAAMETSATAAGEFIRWTTTTGPMAETHWPTVTRLTLPLPALTRLLLCSAPFVSALRHYANKTKTFPYDF